jgi:hypothetical protein
VLQLGEVGAGGRLGAVHPAGGVDEDALAGAFGIVAVRCGQRGHDLA